MIEKIKYILIGIASLCAHGYAIYSFPALPEHWWAYALLALVATGATSMVYVIDGLMPYKGG
ncbi:MAG: hypothetical protein GY743_19180 [Planctomycetaceae bacterium]|nr:hypothetical protein [Planctomycetaceae bacterium]